MEEFAAILEAEPNESLGFGTGDKSIESEFLVVSIPEINGGAGVVSGMGNPLGITIGGGGGGKGG